MVSMRHLHVDQQVVEYSGREGFGLRNGFSKVDECMWNVFIGLGEGIRDGARYYGHESRGIAICGEDKVGVWQTRISIYVDVVGGA